MIDADRLRSLLSYDPDTGEFKWRESGQGRRPSLVAGRVSTRGYSQISIDYKKYAAHRLAWLYVHGELPPHDLDHINGCRADNRIANLRVATEAENTRNRRTPVSNKAGLKGVYRSSPNRWRAQIKVEGRRIVLGHFDKKEDAHAAYCQAAEKHFGPFASSGAAWQTA
jgi:hypothetical protein